MSGGEYILPRAVAERMKLDARARYPELFGPPGAEPIVVTIRVTDTNSARIEDLIETADIGSAAEHLGRRVEGRIRDDIIAAAVALFGDRKR